MLRSKYVALIAVTAIVGIVGGYIATSAVLASPDPGSKPAAAPTEAEPTPTKLLANAGARQGTVPDLRGVRLPDALAQLTAAGYGKVRTVDASPQNRLVIEKENWVVESQEPAAGTAATADTPIVLHVKKNTDDATPGPAERGVVPNVVCAELQAAQNALRASGYVLITSTDGTGKGRVAALDRNWVVIAQSEAPGTKPALTTHIVLTIVKHGEPAGTSGCKT